MASNPVSTQHKKTVVQQDSFKALHDNRNTLLLLKTRTSVHTKRSSKEVQVQVLL